MSVTLELDPQTEARLAAAAAAQGVPPETLIRRLFDLGLTPEDRLARMDARIAARQAADNTPRIAPPVEVREGETDVSALFRKWAEEDALLSPAEVEAAEKLWEDYQGGINEERERSGMRLVF